MEHYRARAGKRIQLGQFYLWYREDRDDWNICWFADGRTHRVSTGVGGGRADHPPRAAGEVLIAWHKKHACDMTLGPVAPSAMLLSVVIDQWLVDHCTKLADPARYACSIATWQRFFDYLERQGDTRTRTVGIIDKGLVEDFMAFRRAEGVGAPTIERDLAALRAALNWGVNEGMLTEAPRIARAKGHRVEKTLEYSPRELAAIIEAAASRPSWAHLLLFILIMIATHARIEALLELMSDQIKGGLIDFNRKGREQTSKYRSVVPIAPSLSYWLEGIDGKVIVYRRARQPGKDVAEAGLLEVPTKHVLLSYRKILLAAHEHHPELGLATQDRTRDGELLWLPPLPEGDGEWRPLMRATGSPNTLRHTIHTWCETKGVVRAQLECAAGHKVAGESMGGRYSHLRPGYLQSFVAGVELLFDELDQWTDAHRHPNDPKRGGSTAENRIVPFVGRWLDRFKRRAA